MSLPVLEAFLAKDYRVVICARSWARPLLSGYPITDFIPLSGRWYQDAQTVKAYKKNYPTEKTLGLSLPDSLSSALVFRWAGIPTAGYKDDGRAWLLKWPINKPKHPLHAVESWYHLAHEASLLWADPIAPKAPRSLHLAGIPEASAEHFHLDPTATNILIAPTAIGLHKGQVKVWPFYEALTQQLKSEGYQVYMCPPANEVDEAETNAPSATRLESLPLLSFAQLCRSVDLVICNDSGVSHLAAAADAAQLTLIGVTEATHTGPWSDQAKVLGQLGTWPSLETVINHIHQRCPSAQKSL